MSLREVTLPVFVRPDQTWIEATVRFILTDSAGRAILGQYTTGGDPVAGTVLAEIKNVSETIYVTPQTEISPESWYTVIAQTDQVEAAYRIQVTPGAEPLEWAEIVSAGAPLDPADLDALTVHLADGDVHLRPGERDLFQSVTVNDTDSLLSALRLAVVDALPGSPSSDTLYFIKVP